MRRWRQAMIRQSCRQRCGGCNSPRWCASLATSSSGWTAIQVRLLCPRCTIDEQILPQSVESL